jgi:acyl-CoA reductase-like NAD-dependent aldehyde dehydrogenase
MVEEGHPHRPEPTSREDLDRALDELQAHKAEWVSLPIRDRISIVEEVRRDFPRTWDRWVAWSLAAKGTAERTLGNDREWLELAPINRIHTKALTALRDIRDHGKPVVPGGYRVLPNGQVAARVYPDSRAHGMAFKGIEIDVWLEAGVTLDEARRRQAAAYNDGAQVGKVALVLGAGNAASLPPSDTFHKLFHDLSVVALKMNPVNSYLGPLLEEAYGALVRRGFLRIVYGGADEGTYLVSNPKVDEVHMTGSDRTFEAVVFGPGDEGRQRKAERTPLVDKPVEGELGCITPWVVVPGEWSEVDIRDQASRMAFWMMRHEGYLCFAPRILVLHRQWALREAFIQALVDALSQVEPIKAYYPGSAETQRTFVAAHPEAVQIGGGDGDHVPWTVIRDLDPTAEGDICYRRESFSGMCGEVSLEAETVPDYIDQAVAFLNDTVWGTLSATLVVSEESLADPETGEAVERAIADLRYGTVALNGPGTWGFYTMIAPWGGFPGSDISDIQSGVGRVANFLMLHRPEKTVMRAPFTRKPYPFVATAKDLQVFSKRLAEFETGPSFWKLPGLYMSAKRT